VRVRACLRQRRLAPDVVMERCAGAFSLELARSGPREQTSAQGRLQGHRPRRTQPER
jgi:hypothetical protein